MSIAPGELGVDVRTRTHALIAQIRQIVHQVGDETMRDVRARAPVRTGGLQRSIQVIHHRKTLGFSIVSEHPAAHIQEYGGTIRPRTVSWLAIPLRGQTVWPRHIGRHRVLSGRRGPYLIALKGGDDTPLWALRRSVTIPARPYIRPAIATARRRLAQLLRSIGGAV